MRRLVLGALLAGLLAGCGSDDRSASDTPSPSASATPTQPAPPSPTAVRPKSPAPSKTPKAPKPADPEPDANFPQFSGPVLGGDVSWPQCPKGMGIPEKRTLGLPMPPPEAEYIIIGLTNGPGFYVNPCLPSQVDYARDQDLLVSAYAVSSYPDDQTLSRYAGSGPFDGSTELGALKNVGYQQARYNVTSMLRTGFETPIVWIDVEPVPDFEWSSDLEANAAVVEGVARGYRDAGYAIGIYSTPYLWETVVGDFELGVPEWRAAGQTSQAEALSRCGPDWVIQGGPAVFGQWVTTDPPRDLNVTCPGISRDMSRWFHRY